MRKLTKEEMMAVAGGTCRWIGDNYSGYWICTPPPSNPVNPPPYCPYNNC